MAVADRIRAERKRQGFTQEEMARRAGMTLNGYAEIERGGVRDPHISSLTNIARALGLTLVELLEEPVAAGKAEAPPAGLEEQERHHVAVLRSWTNFINLLAEPGAEKDAASLAVDAAGDELEAALGLSTTPEAIELFRALQRLREVSEGSTSLAYLAEKIAEREKRLQEAIAS